MEFVVPQLNRYTNTEHNRHFASAPMVLARGDKMLKLTMSMSDNKLPKLTMSGNKMFKLTMSDNKLPKLTMSGNKLPKLTMSGNKMPKLIMSGNKMPKLTMSGNKKMPKLTITTSHN